MGKHFYVAILVLALASGFSCSKLTDKEDSNSIRDKMSAVLHDNSKLDEIKLIELDRLNLDLARAYNKESRPDDAIQIIHELIIKNRNPKDFMGHPFPMSSAFYGMEAIYYDVLADSYGLKKESESQKKALRKATQARETENKLKPIEEAKEKRAKKKEKDSILN